MRPEGGPVAFVCTPTNRMSRATSSTAHVPARRRRAEDGEEGVAPAAAAASQPVSFSGGSGGGAGYMARSSRWMHSTGGAATGPAAAPSSSSSVAATGGGRSWLMAASQPSPLQQPQPQLARSHTAAAAAATTPSPRPMATTTAPSPAAAAAAAASPADARPTKRARRSSPSTTTKEEPGMAAAAAAASSAAAAAAASHSAAAQAALQAQAQFKDNLQCVVCQELPPSEIFQCDHGHLMCKFCHTQIVRGRPLCPICRVRLSVDHPSRNRFAELVKADLRVPCHLDGCNEQVRFSDLNTHMEKTCGFRQTSCLFQPLGCDWRGIANLNAQHEHECPIKSYSAKKVLALVKMRNEEFEEEKKIIERRAGTYQHLCRMLSGKCRDMSIRDLVIELQPNGCMSTSVFTACGIPWEVYLDSPEDTPQPEVKIHLRIVEPIHHKLSIEVFCLPGPALEYELMPTLRRVSFKAGVTQSESFSLPFSLEDAREVHRLSVVSLRMGFLDVTPGVISSSFTTHNLSAAEHQQQLEDAEAALAQDSDPDDDPPEQYEDEIELPLRRRHPPPVQAMRQRVVDAAAIAISGGESVYEDDDDASEYEHVVVASNASGMDDGHSVDASERSGVEEAQQQHEHEHDDEDDDDDGMGSPALDSPAPEDEEAAAFSGAESVSDMTPVEGGFQTAGDALRAAGYRGRTYSPSSPVPVMTATFAAHR